MSFPNSEFRIPNSEFQWRHRIRPRTVKDHFYIFQILWCCIIVQNLTFGFAPCSMNRLKNFIEWPVVDPIATPYLSSTNTSISYNDLCGWIRKMRPEQMCRYQSLCASPPNECKPRTHLNVRFQIVSVLSEWWNPQTANPSWKLSNFSVNFTTMIIIVSILEQFSNTVVKTNETGM